MRDATHSRRLKPPITIFSHERAATRSAQGSTRFAPVRGGPQPAVPANVHLQRRGLATSDGSTCVLQKSECRRSRRLGSVQSKPAPQLGVFMRNVAVGIIRHHGGRDKADNRAESDVGSNHIPRSGCREQCRRNQWCRSAGEYRGKLKADRGTANSVDSERLQEAD